MWVRVAVQGAQKSGNSPAEYEDAAFPATVYSTEAVIFRAAVADGATETSFAGEWARELVRGYGRGRIDPGRPHYGLGALQRRWQAGTCRKTLPWYAQEKLRQGAFSTLLGITIRDGRGAGEWEQNGQGRVWEAAAAGDSCLFHIRQGFPIACFPIESADGFSNHPALLSSLPARASETSGLITRRDGRWNPGDLFLLVTDALAAWLLSANEVGPPVGPRRRPANARTAIEKPATRVDLLLTHLACRERFEPWIDRLRSSGELRNDDVTAVAVQVTEGRP